MKIVLTLALVGVASAACPDGCSGHGTCGFDDCEFDLAEHARGAQAAELAHARSICTLLLQEKPVRPDFGLTIRLRAPS